MTPDVFAPAALARARRRDADAGPARLGMRVGGGRFLKTYPFEEAYFLDQALRFREALSMPLMLLGGINRRETMEQAMLQGSGTRCPVAG